MAIHRPNRTHVSSGRLTMRYRQNAAETSGRTGTHGVRNGRGRSGSRRRSTTMPSATNTNANSVPMFVSSSTQPIGANAADTATNTPVMIVVMWGVLYFGCTRAAQGGSRPSRAIDMKIRAWPSWNTSRTEVIAATAPSARIPVLLVFQLGQARIFMSMARDGLLPPWAARVHPKYKTPHITTIITGIFVAVSAAFAPIGWVLELTNIGTLFAFVLVALGIVVLRRREPDRPRPFRTPWVPVLPLVSAAFCVYLMVNLPLLTWLRFGLWMAIGAAIYFLYGVRHSRVRRLGLDPR